MQEPAQRDACVMRPQIAADGAGARAALKANPPDLLLLDVMLPPEDGLNILSRLRQDSDVAVILLTGRDALLLDHQVHASVQTAAKVAQAAGARVELIPHNDLRTLERRLSTYRHTHRRVWYAADGLYSMYADLMPTTELDELAARHENLWLYVDDAHAVSWTGRHGRGHALEHLAPETLARTVVAA